MLFNSPLSSEKADRLIGLLPLGSESRVIDVGCGTGEFLIRIAEATGACGVGVDIDSASLATARHESIHRKVDSQLQFQEVAIRDYDIPEGGFDCGICLGASHAYAMNEPAYPETLRHLGEAIKPGGSLLIGESYWMREPDPDYLAFIGEPTGTYRTHEENVALAESFGLRIRYATTSSLDEWDDFEWRHHLKIEDAALLAPDNEEAMKRRDRGRAWRAAYLKWGRGTMGFAFYLFRREC